MLRKIGSLLALSYFAVAAAYGAYVYVELPAPYKQEDIKRGAKNADAREAGCRPAGSRAPPRMTDDDAQVLAHRPLRRACACPRLRQRYGAAGVRRG